MHAGKHLAMTGLVAMGANILTGDIDRQAVLMLFAGGVLIDIDHAVYFLWKYGFDFKKIRKVSRECYKESQARFYLFHTWEMILVIGLLALNYEKMKFFWIGYLLHLAMDIYVYLKKMKNREWMKMWWGGYQILQSMTETRN